MQKYFGGFSDIAFGLLFLFTWICPEYFGAESVLYLTITFGMEFLVVHSYGFFGQIAVKKDDLKSKIKIFIPVLCLYSLFGIGFAITAKSIWPLLSFIYLTASKSFAFISDSERGAISEAIKKRWGVMCLLYLLVTFLSIFLPLPELGVSSNVVSAAGFDGGGIWERQPYRALAAGFIYFTLLGIYDILSFPVDQKHQGA